MDQTTNETATGDNQLETKPERTVKVSGNIGEYNQGDIITGDAAICKYYRVCLNEGADVEDFSAKLSDEQILSFHDSVQGDDEDAEVERQTKMEEAINAG